MDKGVCKKCPPGTYSEIAGGLECKKCLKGRYNLYVGADSLCQCYLCEERMFNDKLGAVGCKKCTNYNYCPAGSQKISDFVGNRKLIVSIQPKIYESSYSSYSVTLFQFIGFWVICCVLLSSLFFKKLKS